jgi:hypothetical protein
MIALILLGVGIAHLIKGWEGVVKKCFEADKDVIR